MAGTKTQYVSGGGMIFNDSFPCKHYLNTHGVTEDIALELMAAMKLTFHNEFLYSVEELEFGESTGDRALHFSERGFPYRDILLHPFYSLFADDTGIHQLGGKPPGNFLMPEAILNHPFVYLGFIKNDKASFDWIGVDIIHLVCPIFLSFSKLYLSMDDPLSPKLTSCGIEFHGSQHGPLSIDSFVEFQPVRFTAETNFDKLYEGGDDLGNAGIPEWIQDSEIPGFGDKTMQFLCQLKSKRDIKAISHNLKLDDYPDLSDSFTTFNFWGDGDLFVFYDPKDKLICYQIQNS